MSAHPFAFLVDTYETERLKTLSVWSQFDDGDLEFRPEPRIRTPHEHMVHQCVSEDIWMTTTLAIDAGLAPLPSPESRLGFIATYAAASGARLARLREKSPDWFEAEARFFDVERPRAWILLRRIAHTSHHRGQLTVYLRLPGKPLYSTYGPTADTGGLFQHEAPVIYRYDSLEELLSAEAEGGLRKPLPGPGDRSPTERP
ncbi:MAG: DinB family protein [Gemmatimonadota bacterium]